MLFCNVRFAEQECCVFEHMFKATRLIRDIQLIRAR
jgi:hypothetical protein